MKLTNKNTLYFLFIFLGAGALLFRDYLEGQAQLILTIIALIFMMFGLYKTTSSLTSNRKRDYKDQEFFNREKYDQQEEE